MHCRSIHETFKIYDKVVSSFVKSSPDLWWSMVLMHVHELTLVAAFEYQCMFMNWSLTGCRSPEDGEIIVKTSTDNWVVGKKSDHREFFVVINQKNANLIEINGKPTSCHSIPNVVWKRCVLYLTKILFSFIFQRKSKDCAPLILTVYFSWIDDARL